MAKKPEQPQVSTVHPRLSTHVKAFGQAFSQQEAGIYPPRNGIVDSLHVDLGDRVEEGELIASLKPDRNQAQLAADLAFKQRELNIARDRAAQEQERVESETQAKLLTARQEHQLAVQEYEEEIQRLQAEREVLMVDTEQKLAGTENAISFVLDSITRIMYTRSDALSSYYRNGSHDYYRRREVFYPHDDASRAFESQLLAFYKMFDAGEFRINQDQVIGQAIEIGRGGNLIAKNLVTSPDLSSEEINDLLEDLTDANNRLIDLSSQYLTKKSELAGVEKRLVVLEETGPQDFVQPAQQALILERNPDVIAAEIVRLQRQVGAARTVQAPFDGVITKKHVSIGDSVHLDKELLTVVDDSRKFIRFYVSEAVFPLVREGGSVTFTSAAEPGAQYRATISRIAQAIDSKTNTIQVEADVDDQQDCSRVLTRMGVTVQIPLPEGEPGYWEIPDKALSFSTQPDTLWLSKGSKAKPHAVTVKYRQGGYAYVEEGLTNDDVVIADSPVTLGRTLRLQAKLVEDPATLVKPPSSFIQ